MLAHIGLDVNGRAPDLRCHVQTILDGYRETVLNAATLPGIVSEVGRSFISGGATTRFIARATADYAHLSSIIVRRSIGRSGRSLEYEAREALEKTSHFPCLIDAEIRQLLEGWIPYFSQTYTTQSLVKAIQLRHKISRERINEETAVMEEALRLGMG